MTAMIRSMAFINWRIFSSFGWPRVAAVGTSFDFHSLVQHSNSITPNAKLNCKLSPFSSIPAFVDTCNSCRATCSIRSSNASNSVNSPFRLDASTNVDQKPRIERIEHQLVNYLEEELDVVFFKKNQSVGTAKKYRPDTVIQYDNFYIVIEFDENSHNHPSYDSENEVSRMTDIKEALGKETIFLRMDTRKFRCIYEEGLQWTLGLLLMQVAMFSKMVDVDVERSKVIYLDYPPNHKHICTSKESCALVDWDVIAVHSKQEAATLLELERKVNLFTEFPVGFVSNLPRKKQ